MSVIAELEIPADAFELGRILELTPGVTITLEEMVPLGERAVPFFAVHNNARDSFVANVERHPSVESLQEVSVHDDEILYALNWVNERDLVFEGIRETNAHLLRATGAATMWEFELRFSTHGDLSQFREYCSNAHIPLEVKRVYNPTKPEIGPWFGLTDPQRDTLVRAVEGGYYDIPRRMSTQELADEFGISDQAVTERLRRAIITLVENSLALAEEREADVE